MEKQRKDQLKELSLELFGKTSRWQQLRKPILTEKIDPVSGQKFKSATYLSDEEIFQKLSELKQKRDEEASRLEALQNVQKAAGNVG